ncbi:MAG: Ig-like domain-containing protein [Gemmatimonadota bacterium]|nr:Ig-like domain-containing protein [Gemmatimonadota bacterium]
MNGTPDHSALKIPVSLVGLIGLACLVVLTRMIGLTRLFGPACLVAMACLVGLVAVACAREGMPPGGPRDRIPPWVVETDPPAGSTHVPLDVSPKLTFSERIQPRSIEGNLFIAPIVEFEAEASWRGNEITVRFEEPLLVDRTYIITVGTGFRDMRSNRMDSTFVYALSTGPSIEEGEVNGLTVHDGRPARNTYVWAYDLAGKPDPDPAGTTPDYLTQAGRDGTFTFTHLSAGRYRLFAFLDQGRDRLYDADVDPIGVPTRDVVLSDEGMTDEDMSDEGMTDEDMSDEGMTDGPMWFRMAVNDTAAMHVMSARVSHRRALSVFLSEAPHADMVRDTGAYAIAGVEAGESLDVTSAYQDPADPATIVLITAPQVRDRVYRLIVTGLENTWSEPIDTTENTAEFTGSSIENPPAPRLLEVQPGNRSRDVAQSVELRFSFSEPVSLEEGAVVLRDSTDQEVGGDLRWIDATVAAMRPDSLLQPSADYEILVLAGLVKNGFDQPLQATGDRPDTLAYAFSTIDPEEYGSLSGRFEDEYTAGAGAVGISLYQLRDSEPASEIELDGPGDFRFDNVLPGRYILQAYRDANGNGKFDYGNALPFVPAERSMVHPDTLEVRVGWETEDITLRLNR